MSDKVVSLRSGNEILAPGEPSSTTVELLEKLLEMARSGEIQGMICFLVHSDGAVGADHNADLPMTYALAGRMLQITNEVADRASNRG
jgi:hypothetical protein